MIKVLVLFLVLTTGGANHVFGQFTPLLGVVAGPKEPLVEPSPKATAAPYVPPSLSLTALEQAETKEKPKIKRRKRRSRPAQVASVPKAQPPVDPRAAAGLPPPPPNADGKEEDVVTDPNPAPAPSASAKPPPAVTPPTATAAATQPTTPPAPFIGRAPATEARSILKDQLRNTPKKARKERRAIRIKLAELSEAEEELKDAKRWVEKTKRWLPKADSLKAEAEKDLQAAVGEKQTKRMQDNLTAATDWHTKAHSLADSAPTRVTQAEATIAQILADAKAGSTVATN